MRNRVLKLVADKLKIIIPIWLILSIWIAFYVVIKYFAYTYQNFYMQQNFSTLYLFTIQFISVISVLSSPLWFNLALYNIFFNKVISCTKKAVWLLSLLILSCFSILSISVGLMVTLLITSVILNLTFWIIALIFYKPQKISKLNQNLLLIAKSTGMIWLSLLLIICILTAAIYGYQQLVYFRNKIIMDDVTNQYMFQGACATKIQKKYKNSSPLLPLYFQKLKHIACTVPAPGLYDSLLACEKTFGKKAKKYCEITHCYKGKAGLYVQDVIIKLKDKTTVERCILSVSAKNTAFRDYAITLGRGAFLSSTDDVTNQFFLEASRAPVFRRLFDRWRALLGILPQPYNASQK